MKSAILYCAEAPVPCETWLARARAVKSNMFCARWVRRTGVVAGGRVAAAGGATGAVLLQALESLPREHFNSKVLRREPLSS